MRGGLRGAQTWSRVPSMRTTRRTPPSASRRLVVPGLVSPSHLAAQRHTGGAAPVFLARDYSHLFVGGLGECEKGKEKEEHDMAVSATLASGERAAAASHRAATPFGLGMGMGMGMRIGVDARLPLLRLPPRVLFSTGTGLPAGGGGDGGGGGGGGVGENAGRQVLPPCSLLFAASFHSRVVPSWTILSTISSCPI